MTGSALRWLSTAHPIVCSRVYNRSGFLVAMLGQVLTASASPFITYSPTKLASFWFGEKERSFCTNFASVGEFLHHIFLLWHAVIIAVYMSEETIDLSEKWQPEISSLRIAGYLGLAFNHQCTFMIEYLDSLYFLPLGQMIGFAVSLLVSPYLVTTATELPTLVSQHHVTFMTHYGHL